MTDAELEARCAAFIAEAKVLAPLLDGRLSEIFYQDSALGRVESVQLVASNVIEIEFDNREVDYDA